MVQDGTESMTRCIHNILFIKFPNPLILFLPKPQENLEHESEALNCSHKKNKQRKNVSGNESIRCMGSKLDSNITQIRKNDHKRYISLHIIRAR